jgi:hypothetical protein
MVILVLTLKSKQNKKQKKPDCSGLIGAINGRRIPYSVFTSK